MKRLAQNLLLVGLSVFLAALLGEFVLRAVGFEYPSLYRHDRHTGAALRPDARGWWREEGEAYVSINSAGMRDDREIAREKLPGVFRVVVLGDSYAEALQVPVELTFWRRLEGLLAGCDFAAGHPIEVLNFGVSGYSTGQQLLALRHRVAAFGPDLVLLAFLSGNDVRDNSREIAGSYPRPYFSLAPDGGLLFDDSYRAHWIHRLKTSLLWRAMVETGDHLRLMQLLNKVKNVLGQPLSAPEAQQIAGDIGLDNRVYLSQPAPDWERAWQLTERLVAQVRSESEALGGRFLLVTLSNPGQVPVDPQQMRDHAARLGEADLFFPERRMRAFAKREGIEAVLLAEPFAAHAAATGEYLHGFANTQLGGGHWNERGHALAARLIAERLCAQR
jgi:lysophospholipase L1-like esterase